MDRTANELEKCKLLIQLGEDPPGYKKWAERPKRDARFQCIKGPGSPERCQQNIEGGGGVG